MFYKPKFCCQCGEKVERAEWRLWTSRRFCEFCETEFKGEQLFKSGAAAACLLIGALGMAGLFRQTPVAATDPGASPAAARPAGFAAAPPQAQTFRNETPPSGVSPQGEESVVTQAAAATQAEPLEKTSEQPPRARKSSDKPTYYCGALTKKGTPCSRKVRSKGIRCWQHEGAESALQ